MLNLITAAADWDRAGIVTLAGISIVFSVLILFVLIIYLFGKIFSIGKGNGGQSEKKASALPAVKPAPKSSPVFQAIPADDTDDDLIAVIAAAAYSYLGEVSERSYRIVSIRPAGGSARPVWAQAGIVGNMRKF